MQTGQKRRCIIFSICLFVSIVIILLNMFIHIYRTKEFNNVLHSSKSNESDSQCRIESELVGTWTKNNLKIANLATGHQFDFVISNSSNYNIKDWSLKIYADKDCYINQTWDGTVEIHQNVSSGNEVIQTLDLHNFPFSESEIILEHMGKNKHDLMIRLYKGDYIIYHPSENLAPEKLSLDNSPFASLSRQKNNSNSQSNEKSDTEIIGFIFCNSGETLSFNNYELNYKFDKKISQGAEFYIFICLFTLWSLTLIVFIFWLCMSGKAEKEIKQKETFIEEMLDLISYFVDAKDPYTNGHSERVAEYTYLLALKLGLPLREAKYAYYSAMLHDIGKCYVPDEILKKPGRLTDEEFEIIKSHTIHGKRMLEAIKSIPSIEDGAHYHHERYDGKGYPTGKAGDDIPYVAQIICVADSFDAMNNTRCYRSNLTKEKIIDELVTNKGKQFAPDVVDAMLELIKEGKIKFT